MCTQLPQVHGASLSLTSKSSLLASSTSSYPNSESVATGSSRNGSRPLHSQGWSRESSCIIWGLQVSRTNWVKLYIHLFAATHFQGPEALPIYLGSPTPLQHFWNKCQFNCIQLSPIPEAHFLCCAFWSSGSDALPLGLPALKSIGHSTRNWEVISIYITILYSKVILFHLELSTHWAQSCLLLFRVGGSDIRHLPTWCCLSHLKMFCIFQLPRKINFCGVWFLYLFSIKVYRSVDTSTVTFAIRSNFQE